MKRLTLFLMLVLSTNTMLFCIQPISSLSTTTYTTVFKETFESYSVDKFQPTKNWELEVGLTEDKNAQRIVDNVSKSPTKSLQLFSVYEGVRLHRETTTTGDYIGYKIFVMMASIWDGSVSFGFANENNQVGFSGISIWADRIDAVAYDDFAGMRNGIELQRDTEEMKWYNVTVLTNKKTYEFSVWIDDVLKASGLNEEPGRSDYGPIDSFYVGCWGGGEDEEQKVYLDDITVYQGSTQPQQRTKMTIKSIECKKWNVLNVPFKDVAEANAYIQGFETTHEAADFGSIPISIQIKNTGSYKAQGNIIVRMTGDILMIAYGEEETKVVPYHFDYNQTTDVNVDSATTINKTMSLAVKYCSIISSELKPKDEGGNEVSLELVLTMVSIDLTISIKGNFDDVTYIVTNDVLGIGDPNDLLRKWNAELWPRVKEKMLRKMLEKYYSEVLNITPNIQTIGIPTGIYEKAVTISPGITKIGVSFVIPAGITLVGLTLLPWGVTTPVGATLIAAGVALAVINYPTPGQAMINLETKLTMYQMLATSSSMNLEIVQMVPNNIKTTDHTVNFSGKTLHVSITSNSSLGNFAFSGGQINLDTKGPSDTTGFIYLLVPKSLMKNVTAVYVYNKQTKIVFAENSTHTFVYFTYRHPGHITAVPEFPSLIMLSIFMAMTLAAVVVGRRRQKKNE